MATIDSQILTQQPADDSTLVRIKLHKGYLDAPKGPHTWVFPPILSGNVKSVNLAPEFTVAMKEVETFKVKITRFDGIESEFPFTETSSKVEIFVNHLCDQNPLDWHTDHLSLPPDDDFRWHFDLLDPGNQG